MNDQLSLTWLRSTSMFLIDHMSAALTIASCCTQVEDSAVLRFPQAVTHFSPGSYASRPLQTTSFTNVFMAGDWVKGVPHGANGLSQVSMLSRWFPSIAWSRASRIDGNLSPLSGRTYGICRRRGVVARASEASSSILSRLYLAA